LIFRCDFKKDDLSKQEHNVATQKIIRSDFLNLKLALKQVSQSDF
jgi:hypothetical protein